MFKLRFNTGSEAFTGLPEMEAARILRDVAYKIEAGHIIGNVLDLHGNAVGEFQFDVLPMRSDD